MTSRSTTSADRPTATGATTQHGEPEIDAEIDRRSDGGIAAQHQELAMREVDHPHHAEDHREPEADQHEAGDGTGDLQQEDTIVRAARSHSSSSPRRASGDQIFTSITYCWLVVGVLLAGRRPPGCRPAAAAGRSRAPRSFWSLHLADVDVEDGVVGLRVDRGLAGRARRTTMPLSSASITFIRSTLPALVDAPRPRCCRP